MLVMVDFERDDCDDEMVVNYYYYFLLFSFYSIVLNVDYIDEIIIVLKKKIEKKWENEIRKNESEIKWNKIYLVRLRMREKIYFMSKSLISKSLFSNLKTSKLYNKYKFLLLSKLISHNQVIYFHVYLFYLKNDDWLIIIFINNIWSRLIKLLINKKHRF